MTPEMIKTLERAADLLGASGANMHVVDGHQSSLFGCDDCNKGPYFVAAAEVRALIPKPAPKCPSCNHLDDEHGSLGCEGVAEEAECSCAMTEASSNSCPVHGTAGHRDFCPCRFPDRVLDDLRELLAPDVDHLGFRPWLPGDGEPEYCSDTDCKKAGYWGATGRMPEGHFMYHPFGQKSCRLAHYASVAKP